MPAPAPGLIGRVPPQDIEAEMSLLGSMMLNRDAIGDVLPIIAPEAGTVLPARPPQLFEVLVDMYDRGDPIDLVTVRNELDRRVAPQRGRRRRLPRPAGRVRSLPPSRRALRPPRPRQGHAPRPDRGRRASHRGGLQPPRRSQEILDRAEQLLFQVTDQRISEQAAPIRDSLEEIFHQIEARDGHYITGVPTGFIELDDMLSGLQKGEMIIVAARPSMGKTAFGLNIAEHVATRERKPAVVLLDGNEQAGGRPASAVLAGAGRLAQAAPRHALGRRDRSSCTDACGELAEVPAVRSTTRRA